MVSSDLGTRDILNSDTGHTDGTHGHDVMNDWIDIATRPASVNSITHSAAGTLTINANQGHVVNVEVQANITGLTINNLVEGLPMLLILKGDGVSTRTADMSSIFINPTTTLNSSLEVLNNDVHHIMLTKGPSIISDVLWAPAGVISWNANIGAAPSGIQLQSTNQYLHTGSFSTSHTIPLPSGIQSGDLLEIIVATQESSDPGVPNTPSGWTQRYTTTPVAGFNPRQTLFYKIATGSEGSSVNVTIGTSTRMHGVSNRWSGVDNTTPYDATEPAAVTSPTDNVNPAAITTVTNGAFVRAIAAANLTGGASGTVSSGYTILNDTTAEDRFFLNCYKEVSTAGSEDPGAYTWDVDNVTCVTSALRPA